MMKVVSISGNLSRPSKTSMLGSFVAERAAIRLSGQHRSFDLLDAQPQLGATVWRSNASGSLDDLLTAIETCDLLVVGSPVYKASYTGMLKHLFDLFDMQALRDRPVLLFATGKAPPHGPLVEHGLRSLFSFFDARPIGAFIYALDADFEDGQPGSRLTSNVDRVLDEAVQIIAARSA